MVSSVASGLSSLMTQQSATLKSMKIEQQVNQAFINQLAETTDKGHAAMQSKIQQAAADGAQLPRGSLVNITV